MKLKNILKIGIPIFILGTVIVLSNMDFGYSVIKDNLPVQGIITDVSEKYIVIENGKEYKINNDIIYDSSVENLEMNIPFAEGNYIVGTYSETSSGNVIDKINVNVFPAFRGKIISLDNLNAIVEPNEDEVYIRSSGDQVYVKLPVNSSYEVGDEINVEFDGALMESYPLQIVTYKVDGIFVN